MSFQELGQRYKVQNREQVEEDSGRGIAENMLECGNTVTSNGGIKKMIDDHKARVGR